MHRRLEIRIIYMLKLNVTIEKIPRKRKLTWCMFHYARQVQIEEGGERGGIRPRAEVSNARWAQSTIKLAVAVLQTYSKRAMNTQQ